MMIETMANYYMLSKKVHRIFVLIIIVLGAIMAVTGLDLKYPIVQDNGVLRFVHNNLSPFFTIVLAIMALTGAYLYFYPWYTKRKAQKAAEKTPEPEQKPAETAQS